MSPFSQLPSGPRCFPWRLVLTAVLIPLLYLPTLALRFDFTDDSVLVYPGPPRGLAGRARQVWANTVADFRWSGPFRPLTWAHWQTEACLLGSHHLPWRIERLLWAMLSAGLLLWLLAELGIQPLAAGLATALSLWNPYRGEIWMALGLTEALAMPYAMLALVCAVRAARAARPLAWDGAGTLCLLAALAVKNTFAGLAPALVVLRWTAGGLSLREGWKRQGGSCCWYLAPLLLPLGHFVALKLWPSPTHHATAFTLIQAWRLFHALQGAICLDLLAPGLVLAGLAIWKSWPGKQLLGEDRSTQSAPFSWSSCRPACLAGLALLLGGSTIYLPINGVAGRYTLPAAWGLDLLLAVLFRTLAAVPVPSWRRLAFGLLGCAVVGMAISNVGRQLHMQARHGLLWEVLEYLSRQPSGTVVAWVGNPKVGTASDDLPCSEGGHFLGHLVHQGGAGLEMKLLSREESVGSVSLALTGTPVPPSYPHPDAYRLVRVFRADYWLGCKSFRCYLWAPRKE